MLYLYCVPLVYWPDNFCPLFNTEILFALNISPQLPLNKRRILALPICCYIGMMLLIVKASLPIICKWYCDILILFYWKMFIGKLLEILSINRGISLCSVSLFVLVEIPPVLHSCNNASNMELVHAKMIFLPCPFRMWEFNFLLCGP